MDSLVTSEACSPCCILLVLARIGFPFLLGTHWTILPGLFVVILNFMSNSDHWTVSGSNIHYSWNEARNTLCLSWKLGDKAN